MQSQLDDRCQPHGLRPHFVAADGIAALFAPFVEVVVHDLATDTIAHIARSMSHRQTGDPSQLSSIGFKAHQSVIGPYEKTNWDGRRMKCISIVLRSGSGRNDGKPIGLMCINLDVSGFGQIRQALDGFLGLPPSTDDVGALFVQDWHERINRFVTEWCAAQDVRVQDLGKADRRCLIGALQAIGAFEARRAPAYVARILSISRATVYNELSALRQESMPK